MPKVNKKISDLLKISKKWNKKVKWVKDDKQNQLQRLPIHQTLKELVAFFTEIYPQFLKYSFIKRAQAESLESVASKFDEYLIHVDFPENFMCEAQSEVQGAHWNQFQVSATLCFTVALFT